MYFRLSGPAAAASPAAAVLGSLWLKMIEEALAEDAYLAGQYLLHTAADHLLWCGPLCLLTGCEGHSPALPATHPLLLLLLPPDVAGFDWSGSNRVAVVCEKLFMLAFLNHISPLPLLLLLLVSDVAGLHWSGSSEGVAGFEVRLDGFSHKLDRLADTVFQALAQCKVRKEGSPMPSCMPVTSHCQDHGQCILPAATPAASDTTYAFWRTVIRCKDKNKTPLATR